MITELYPVYRAELLKYCRSICGNAGDAEDLLQETFTRALSSLDLLEELGEKERRAWLYRVARNLFYDSCRRKAVRQRHLPQPEAETDCALVVCTKEQEEAVNLVAEDAAMIRTAGQDGEEAAGETPGDPNDNVSINAAEYKM